MVLGLIVCDCHGRTCTLFGSELVAIGAAETDTLRPMTACIVEYDDLSDAGSNWEYWAARYCSVCQQGTGRPFVSQCFQNCDRDHKTRHAEAETSGCSPSPDRPMFRSAVSVLGTALFAVALNGAAAATCSGARSLSVCAQWINPFSLNNFTWQTTCGVPTPATDILMAGGLQFNTGSW